jgi:putative peptidoglycan lipid II flippase
MGFAVLCSRLLGLIREQLFAYFFGATHYADAFLVAFRIPNLFRDLFAEGAMSAALVPVFIRVRSSQGEKAGWRLARHVFVALFGVTFLFALVGMFFSEQLVRIYASGFGIDSEKFFLTVHLTQFLFLFFPFVCLAAGFMGVLNALGFFFWPAFSSALFNLSSILVVLVTYWWLPLWGVHAIWGMALGVLLGGVVQAFSQLPCLYQSGFRLKEKIDFLFFFRNADFQNILRLIVPATFGLAATQMNVLMNTIWASSLEAGTVAHLNYAFRLMQFPIGLFGVSFASALLSQVSADYAKKKYQQATFALEECMKMILVVNMPAAVGLACCAPVLIRLIFQHGVFLQDDTEQTARLLMAYALGLPAYSLVKVMVPVCYVFEKVRLALFASFFAVFCSASISFFFMGKIGALALALATSFAAMANSLVLFYGIQKALKKRQVEFHQGALIRKILQVLFAVFGMAFFVLIADHFWQLLFFSSFLNDLLRFFCLVVIGVVSYFFLARKCGVVEVEQIKKIFFRRFF